MSVMFVAAAPCTLKTAIKGAETKEGAAKISLAKKAKVTLLSADDNFAQVSTEDGKLLFVATPSMKKACGAQALKDAGEEVAGGDGEQSMALRVARQVDAPPPPSPTPAPATPRAAPTPPTAAAPAPAAPTPEAAAPAVNRRLPDARRDKNKLKVAVMDLKASEQVPKELRAALTALIPETLDELGPFKAISKSDIEQMLALEAMKDSLGCSEVSCLAEIGGALGADYIVGGSIVLVGDTYLTQLQLLNIKTQRAEQRISREYRGGPQGLLDEMRLASKLIVRDLLAQRSGLLRLTVSEEGATVRIDGSIVGTTPLKPLSLSGGPHTLIVEREQFVRQSADIQIHENETTAVDVKLLPSEEFKKSYRAKAMTTRIAAWSLSGLGAAGLATGIALLAVNQGNATKVKDESFAYNDAGQRPQASYDDLRARQGAANTMDALAITALCVGVAAGAVGVVLFVTGDNPNKYDATLQVAPGGVVMRF